MDVLALLDRAAAQVRRVEQLVGQLLLHRLAVAARRRVADDPADAEREPAVWVHFDRHLVVAAADAARLHLEARLDVVDRLLEDLERIVARLLFDDVEALVEDPRGGAALAVAHDRADELGHQRALINRIRRNFALRNFTSTRHIWNPVSPIADCGLRTISDWTAIRNPHYAFFGLLAPYFDRPCMRPCTPTAPRVPRTTCEPT